jgi:hypothetical protein
VSPASADEVQRVKRRTSPVFFVAFAAVLTGCGGAPVEAEKPKPRPSVQASPGARTASAGRADLIAQAKAVCARLEDRFAGLAQPTTPPTGKQLLAIVNAWAVTIDELHDLTPPPGEASRFNRMLNHFDHAIRAGRALPQAGGEMTLVPLAAMADAGMRGGTIAHSYGLDECSLFPPAPAPGELDRHLEEQMRRSGGIFEPGGLANPPGGRLKDRLPKPKERP